MPVIAYAVAADVLDWLWRHRTEVGPSVEGLVDRVLARDGTSVDRVGAALVAQEDGQRRVIGLLQEVSGKADAIQDGVGTLAGGQQALAHSLSVLQTLSVVNLGVTALSQVYLWRQFSRLNRRLDELGRAVERIQTMIQSGHRASIETGLTQLRHGTEALAEGKHTLAEKYLTDAFDNLAGGANNFAGQLKAELDRRPDRGYLGLLARYMTVAVLGEAGCQVALGKGAEAARAIEGRLPVLKAYARRVFAETAGRDPGRFLIPAMAAEGVTLDALAGLFRQAALAGLIDYPPGRGASDLFDALRGELFRVQDPVFRKARAVARMTAELAEARAAVEDVNRVEGLALGIRAFDAPGRPFRDLAAAIDREIAARADSDPAGYFAYVASTGDMSKTSPTA